MRGEKHWSWKGGRSVTSGGYITLIKRGHPRSTQSNNRVLEHVLVMEKMIGRYLYPFENVHHKNGIKTDNEPSNLELWTKPQTPGQRVEDLLSWVVDNYRSEVEAKLSNG